MKGFIVLLNHTVLQLSEILNPNRPFIESKLQERRLVMRIKLDRYYYSIWPIIIAMYFLIIKND